jgi:hypothetical protein
MSSNANPVFYELTVYLLGGACSLLLGIVIWIIKSMKSMHDRHFETGRECKEAIAVLKKDIENLRHEHERNHK